jgi:ribosome maturation factor RimP
MGRRPIFCFLALRRDGTMLRDALVALLKPVVEGLGMELWELEFAANRGNGLLRLYIDSTDGVTLDDCERVSRAVSDVLDREDPLPGHYTLEVSSPGLDRPLRTAAQFARFVGEQVFVELSQPANARRRLKGALVAAGEESIELEVDGRRHELSIAEIRKAHLAPDV